MAQAQKGDRVAINFTGTLEDGTVFDTTLDNAECDSDDCGDGGCTDDDCDCGCESGPMELTIGSDEFFTQIEEGLIGMAPGEKKTVTIPAEEAFGEYDEEKVFSIPREQFPADITPEVGQELVLTDEEGEDIGVTVVEVTDEGVTLDANHPLAGENITYEYELVEIL
ncbi:MAG: peptidylprolyl isomerase [Desulfuromonadales bacterium]|nr:MAG: peptidylprolyl isomerase [Desulfuromonadales bacterium]